MNGLMAATLLLVRIAEGTPITPLGTGIYFETAGRQQSLMIVPRDEAALTLDDATRAPGITIEEGTLLGYRSVLVRQDSGGPAMVEALWIDFGGEHVVLSSFPVPDAPEPIIGPPPTIEPGPLRDAFRAGRNAGRHPGDIEVVLDGLTLTDTADRLSFDFFEGPLTLEIRAATAE